MILKSKLRLRQRILIGALCLLATACGGRHLPPNVSPEGKVAIYAREAVLLTDGVLTVLDTTAETVLVGTTDEAARAGIKRQVVAAATVAQRAGGIAVDLASELRAWHALHLAGQAEGSAIVRVRAILERLQVTLTSILAPIDNGKIRSAVTTAVQAVLSLVLTVDAILPAAPA